MPRVLRSTEGKVKRKKRLKVLIAGAVVLATCTVGALSWLSFRPALVISEVRVEGNEAVHAESVKEKAFASLSGKHLYLFARANAFLYPKEEIASKIAEDFPRAESITLSLDGLETLVVHVVERKGESLWCDPHPEMRACYFVDENGFIFAEAPNFSGDAYFAYYGSFGTSTSPIGQNFLPQEIFRALADFVESVKKFGFSPTAIHVGEEQYAEMILHEGWRLIFHLDQDFEELEGNLAALSHSEKWGAALHGERSAEGRLEYVDLRFGSKVYYRFAK